MTKNNDGRVRFIALAHSLLDHVATALAEQKRSSESIVRLEHARSNLLPLGEFFAERCGGDEDAYWACYHLIEAVVTIMDPEAHAEGLGAALVRQSHSIGGYKRGEQMTAQALAWEKYAETILTTKVLKYKSGKVYGKIAKGKKVSIQDLYDDLDYLWGSSDIRLPGFRQASPVIKSLRDNSFKK
jgi:hypothetical protein